ncbi:hypothetical protein CR956_01635 [Candidatus Saccharibacteria bacterium]|nr:MAG: hypothetical protein CR956_01635 [Candidatus Saccharibacteria bacterium]
MGKNGKLPWGRSLPADLRRFKALTLEKTVIMGRKTFESIGFVLPERENIVISTQLMDLPGVVKLATSIEEAYEMAHREIFVIGGASVYEQALDDVEVIYATEVEAEFDGVDTFFPNLDDKQWRETTRLHHEADSKNDYSFDFVTYERI